MDKKTVAIYIRVSTLDQAIQLIKSGWATVKNWVGNIPILNQAINLIKYRWTTVNGWIGSIPFLAFYIYDLCSHEKS